MAGIWDLLQTGAGKAVDFLKSDSGPVAAGVIGGLLGLTGAGDSGSNPVGYTGGIPNYIATREAVPGAFNAEDRRPGQGGRRYFTDTQYAVNPASPIVGKTAEQLAADNAAAQAAQLRNEQYRQALLDALISSGGSTSQPTTPTTPSPTTPSSSSGQTGQTGNSTVDNAWMQQSQTFTDAQWRNIMDTWAAQNPRATKAQVDSALTEFGVPSHLYGYAYSKSGAINDPMASQGQASATSSADLTTPGAPVGPGGADLYNMLQDTVRYAANPNSIGGAHVSKNEIDQIWDLAKTLGMSVSQITEMVNMNMPGAGITAGQVADALRWVAPNEADAYLSQIGGSYDPNKRYARGGNVQAGLAALSSGNGYYLGGATDGMADEVPAVINGKEPAALADGEFVWPADVVSDLGNGNSNAGAKVLYNAMDRIRKARHGTTKQGRQIDPNKFLPA